MTKKVLFDSLNHAKMLERGGISHADVHAEALLVALAQSTYGQCEVDKMIENTFKRFDERTVQIRQEMQKEFCELRLDIKDTEERLLTKYNRILVIATAILTIYTTLLHFVH